MSLLCPRKQQSGRCEHFLHAGLTLAAVHACRYWQVDELQAQRERCLEDGNWCSSWTAASRVLTCAVRMQGGGSSGGRRDLEEQTGDG